MYFRVYQVSNAIYPGWGYNLTYKELRLMALWYLNSLFEQETISEDEYNQKIKIIEAAQEEQLINEIQDMGEADGGLEVQKSDVLFDISDLGPDEEIERPWKD